MEDANFSLEMTHRPKPGVLEKCAQSLPDTNRWFRRRYTLREALGGPRNTAETMMNVFYRHLKIGTLSENG